MRRGHQRPDKSCRQSGLALVAVMMLAIIMLTLLAAVGTLVLADSKQTGLQARQQQAYYLAEAGLEKFMAALMQAARDQQADINSFPYKADDLENWVDLHVNVPNQQEPNQLGSTVVTAYYVREDGQPITHSPPYSHLIHVESTGTVAGVSKTVEATIDLQYLAGIFQYALNGLEKSGPAIQFSGSGSVAVRGSLYTDGDIQTNGKRGFPRDFSLNDGDIRIGANSPITGAESLPNIPSGIPVTKLAYSLPYPSFRQTAQALGATGGDTHPHFLIPIGNNHVLDIQFNGWNWLLLPDLTVRTRTDRLLYYSSDVAIFGNLPGVTVITNGNLYLVGLLLDSSDRSLYIARGNVYVGAVQISAWLHQLFGSLLAVVQNTFNLLNIPVNLENVFPPPGPLTCYIYAPESNVTFSYSTINLVGGVAAQTILFEGYNSLTIDNRSNVMSDFSPNNRPELYIPQPVVIERHTR